MVVLICGMALLLAGWVVAGQSPANLPAYLSQVYTLSAAYNGAAALNALPELTARGLVVVALLAAIIALRFTWIFGAPARRLRLEGGFMLLWACALVFLLWKHGFNRADLYHMGFFFGFAAILPFALDIVGSAQPEPEPAARGENDDSLPRLPKSNPAQRHRRDVFMARILGLVCCILILSTLTKWFLAGLPEMLLAPIQNVALNVRTLAHWSEWVQERNQARESALADIRLPSDLLASIGASNVDVFGANQVCALHNDLNYRPRPVFQSYCALNATLNRLNDGFFTSAQAPQFVLFGLNSLDHKFPPLEDAYVLRDLLLNYRLVSSNTPTLVLRRHRAAGAKVRLLREETVSTGKPIEIKPFGSTNLWLQIDVAPTFAGKCRQFLYKPAPVRLAVWFNPGDLRANPLPGRTSDAPGGRDGNTKALWKAPPPMLSAGFLASPLLLDDRDFVNVLGAGTLRRPIAYSVEVDPDSAAFWQTQIRYRIYALQAAQ